MLEYTKCLLLRQKQRKQSMVNGGAYVFLITVILHISALAEVGRAFEGLSIAHQPISAEVVVFDQSLIVFENFPILTLQSSVL